jgi:hypothetical protein
MTTQNFLIGPVKDGLRKDVRPFAIPEDAFETLENARQFRGRIVRRDGYTLLGNLANGTPVMGLRTRELFGLNLQQLIAFDTTQAYFYNGTAFVNLPSTMPVTWNGTNFNFFYSTNYAGAFWATNNFPGLNGVAITNAVAGGGITTITTTANTFVTGQFVTIININPLSTSDLNGNVYEITVVNPTTFTIPFATTTGYTAGNGFALNSQNAIAGQDGIRYYAATDSGNTWVNYNPPIDPNNALAGALLIFPYRGYLVFLNTSEGNETGLQDFPNRARWTQVGTPYYSEPAPITPSKFGTDPNTARDDLFGRGGAIDAPTSEAIVAAGFIRDILIVYFERSCWRLRFVNNAQNPFVWERINVEFGSFCTFSPITFDKGLMAIGDRGIVISDANDVQRFDEKIPDDIFDIRASQNGFERVYGIRTFRTRLCYWTYPSDDDPLGIFPDKVLVYNYDTKNWSYYDDCFTCFGYFYPSGTAQTWSQMTDSWSSYDMTWDSGISSFGQETVVAGNQQGFVFLLEQTDGQNSVSLNISGITAASPGVITSTNHNLKNGMWIKLSGVTGTTSADGVSLNNRNFKVAGYNPSTSFNTFTLTEFEPISAPNASPTSTELSYSYQIGFTPILPTSVNIWIGTDLYQDTNGVGIIQGINGLGTIDYLSGQLNITFGSAYTNSPVNIYVVSYNAQQDIVPVDTTGAYGGGGQITKISNFDIQTKYFNFLKDDKRSRLSKIDFYVDQTDMGQFTVNVFSDSSDTIVNQPLPDNLQSNVVLTSQNPYQFGSGEETFFRLFSDAVCQTVQLQLTLSDEQMAVDTINNSAFELLSMIISIRKGGRLV